MAIPVIPWLALALLIWVVPVQAGRAYYVSPGGDDTNSGDLDHPWRTLQKAALSLAPGDTARVHAGEYHETVRVEVSGSQEGGYVVFQPFGDGIPVVDGTGIPVAEESCGLFLIDSRHYVEIDGFEIRNLTTSLRERVPVGIHVLGNAHHIRLVNNDIHHIQTHAPVDGDGLRADAHGIAVYGSSAPEAIHDLLIQGNRLHDLTLGSSEALALNGNIEHFTVAHNHVYACDNIGIDLIGFEGTAPDPAHDQVRHGVVSGNHVHDISSYGNPAYGEEYGAAGVYADGARDVIVERNWIHRCDIGVELASEHAGRSTSGLVVRDNVIYGNLLTGLSMGGYDRRRGTTDSCAVLNNTLFGDDVLSSGSGELQLQFGVYHSRIQNNVIRAGKQALLLGNPYSENSGNVVDYNLWFAAPGKEPEWQWRGVSYQGLSAYQSATGNDRHSVYADPGFVGPVPADWTWAVPLPADTATVDLHLRADSPGVDRGLIASQLGDVDIDGEPRVQGGRVDLGADETAPVPLVGDFDRSGQVDLADFFLFADHFGGRSGSAGYDARYDLDGDGIIGLADFFLFADAFGR